MKTDPDQTSWSSPDANRKARMALEAERIAAARASVAAGRVVASEQVDDWIESLLRVFGPDQDRGPP